MTEIMDFTPTRRTIQFRIDDDVFTANADVPALVLMEFSAHADQFERVGIEERREILKRMFDLVLTPASSETFMARLSSFENPIGAGTMNRVIPWLMEQYGLLPTQPSGSSSAGPDSPESGRSSMVVVPAAESILAPSP